MMHAVATAVSNNSGKKLKRRRKWKMSTGNLRTTRGTKENRGVKLLSNVKNVLHELGGSVPSGYLAELGKVWGTVKSAK